MHELGAVMVCISGGNGDKNGKKMYIRTYAHTYVCMYIRTYVYQWTKPYQWPCQQWVVQVSGEVV